MIIEMRTYRIKAGLRSRFIELFLSRAVPRHHEIGMKISGPFLSVEDPDVFFWMRAFPDLATRDRMKETFYEGPLWKDELEGIMMPMLEHYDVVLVSDEEDRVRWLEPAAVERAVA